jgi:hypothetical protein
MLVGCRIAPGFEMRHGLGGLERGGRPWITKMAHIEVICTVGTCSTRTSVQRHVVLSWRPYSEMLSELISYITNFRDKHQKIPSFSSCETSRRTRNRSSFPDLLESASRRHNCNSPWCFCMHLTQSRRELL